MTVFVSVVALVLVACGETDTGDPPDPDPAASPTETGSPTAEPGDDFAALVEAAQAEGELVWYTSDTDYEQQAAAFEARYGIHVQALRLTAPDLTARFSAEAEVGNFFADVVSISDSAPGTEADVFNQWEEAGYIVPLADNIPDFPPPGFDESFFRGNRAVVIIRPWLLGINTDLVASAPPEWDDILDPEFADGNILLADPASSFAYVQFWMQMYELYGESFFEEFRTLDARVFPSGAPATESLGAGEGKLLIPASISLMVQAMERGAPVELHMSRVLSATEMGVSLVDPERTTSPNAAKLFIHWLSTAEAGEVLWDDSVPVLHPALTEQLAASGYQTAPPASEEELEFVMQLLGLD